MLVFLLSVGFASAVTDADLYQYLQLQLTFETNVTHSEDGDLSTVVCLSGNCPSQDGAVKKVGSYSGSWDGSNDMLTVAGEPKWIMGGNAGDDSICAWVNPHTGSYNTNDGFTGWFCSTCSDYWYAQVWGVVFYSQMNFVGSNVVAGNLNQDEWSFVCYTFDDATDDLKAYINGSYQATTNVATNMGDDAGGDLWIGGSGNGINRFKPMNLDNYMWFNKSLSADEVTYLYNSGSGRTISSVVLPVVSINGVNLTNRSRVDYPSFLNTFNEYFVETNVTVDGVFDAGLEVNLTGAVTDVFSNYNVFLENKTLTSSNSFEFSFVDNASNIDYQIPFRFRVCRNGIVEDLSLYWNDNLTPYRVINSVIPNCASGYHEEFNLSTSASMFKNNNNISIRCSGCLGSNTIRLVNFGDGSYYKFYRKHTVGFHEFYANASNELYWFTNHAHTFLDSGVKGFNISANGTTFEFLLTVADIPPNASFFNIVSDGVDYNFSVNDSSVESGNQVRVVGDCSQEVISFKQLNITYFGNNTLIKSVNDEVINVTSTELSGNNKFVARLYCKDNDGEFTSLTRTFWANDSVNPIGNLISPSGDVNINSSAQVQFLGSDKNLFGVNLTVDCTVQGLVFSYLNTSFIGSSLFIDNVTSALTVEQDCTVSWEVCDDHTDTVFLVDKVKSDYYDKNISVSDRLILSDYSVYNVNELVFIEKKDRLSWSYSYTTYEDKFKKDKKYSYRIPKFGNGWVLRDEGTALFSSWDTKFWLDFVSKDARVDGISEDSAYFYVDVLSDSDVVTFESLGGINCVSDTFLFSVVTPAPVVPVTSIEDVSAGFSLFLLFVGVLYLGFILLGTALGVPVVAFLGLFFGFVLGIMLIPVIAWFGVSLLVLNVVMFIGFVMADY